MNFSPAKWRLLITSPAHGAWNMAVDEALLESSSQDRTISTLRMYAWEPACLSLGYAQPHSDVDVQALEKQGWELVRRPTGGRAILHVDELTYSVTGPESEPRLARSILEIYRTLSRALLTALINLGIPAKALPKSVGGGDPGTAEQNPVCFEVPSNYEITVDGKKLVGSAQARRRGGVLQHGSLPLYGDIQRIIGVLVFPDQEHRQQAAQRLMQRATTVEQVLGKRISWVEAAQSMTSAFRQTLNLELVASELTSAELERIDQLLQEKYANPSWNAKM